MSETEIKVCRLCLKAIDGKFKSLDPTLCDIIAICLPDVHLGVSSSPVFCEKCVELINLYYALRSMSIENEEKILSYIETSSIPLYGKLNIALVTFLDKYSEQIPEDHPEGVCRLCLSKLGLDATKVFSIRRQLAHGLRICEMIDTCLPEVDLNVTDKQFICRSCFILLKASYRLKIIVEGTNSTIRSYLQNNLQIYGKVNLFDICKNKNEIHPAPAPRILNSEVANPKRVKLVPNKDHLGPSDFNFKLNITPASTKEKKSDDNTAQVVNKETVSLRKDSTIIKSKSKEKDVIEISDDENDDNAFAAEPFEGEGPWRPTDHLLTSLEKIA